MTTRSKILSLLLVLVLALFSVFAVACDRNNGNGNGNEEPAKTEWPEAGVYYFDAGNDEYTLTLNVGDTFVLYVKGDNQSGSYKLTDATLELDFNAEGKDNLTANYEGSVISLTYEGASYRFLKKTHYEVSFNVNGGSAVEAQTVLNGKFAAKPADPTREGYVFVGWYQDSECKTSYEFGSQPVTANTVIYANWSKATVSGMEYDVKLDANYDGAAALGTVTTKGGQLFGLSTPERTGYTFGGWWFSSENDGSMLTSKYENGMVLNGNTTLYAFWQLNPTDGKLPAPIVKVTAGNISWDTLTDARSYAVKVIGPDGGVIVDETTASNVINVAFGNYAAGKYEIRVVANSNKGEQYNSETVRYYVNKSLDKVSLFDVIGSTLIFNTVENAEKYLVTVVCGNPDHNHTAFDNGSSRTFSFANCTMTEKGITFTVTAVAEGYASSTSEAFTYVRALDAVTGLRLDEATETLVWNEVANAACYMVSVQCGNADHNHGFVNFGSQTFVSLKECAPCEGGIVVKVYPKTEGYNSPAAVTYVYDKATLNTPENLLLNGTLLSWNAVEGATEYEVKVNGVDYKTNTNSFDLSATLNWVEGSEYTVSVRVAGTAASLWTDELVARYYEMSELVTYSKNTLTWAPVIGAEFYEVRVNGGEIITVDGGAISAKVALTRAGVNTLEVRFADGQTRSEWASTTVVAHKVTFDTLGGSYVAPQYKAVGDLMEISAPTKTGYTFVNWYNVPGGAASNGMAYTDEIFTESGAIVLYAYYAANKYNVTYNYGEGGTGSVTSDEVSYESNYTLTVPTASNVAGAFGGWFSAPYGTGTQYTDEKGNSLAPWTSLEGKELYAFWIDEALKFVPTKVNGKDAYTVSKGSRIDLVSEVTVPAYYKGLPVAVIAGNAFENCSNLKTINLPATIEQISLITPFGGCSALSAINVYDVEGVSAPKFWSLDGVLFENGENGAASKLVLMPLAKTGTYRIPAGIVEIPESAFAGSAITKVVVPASVTKIGRDAFSGCTKLTSVVFEAAAIGESEQALMISARAFSGCVALEKIILPARLTDIKLQKSNIVGNDVLLDNAENAFLGCDNLVSITVAANNNNYKSVDGVLYSKDGKQLLYCPATVSGVFTVPTGTLAVAPGAFVGCANITEVVLPNTLSLVGDAAFFGLSGLTKVTFQGNAFGDLTVGKHAFRDCKMLTDIVLEENSRVAVLSEGAFMGCTNLETLTIPATMSDIKAEAFRDCEDLAEVIFAENGKTLTFGENVFYNCVSLSTVSLPANVSAIPGIFSGCTSLEAVNVAENSEYFTSVEGVVFDKNITEILFFPQGKSGEYTLPETVTKIANGVFGGVTKLTKLTVSNALTVIGDEAFKGAVLDEIAFTGEATGTLTIGTGAFDGAEVATLNLPAHVTTIGDYAFANFETYTFSLQEGVTAFGDYAFYNSELDVTVPASVKTIGAYCFSTDTNEWYPPYATVTFAENSTLEYIGEYAFSANGLSSMVLPASVKTIGAYAFYECEDLDEFTFAENSSLETIGAFAFSAGSSWYVNGITEITIPKSVTSIGAHAFEYTGLQTVTFEAGGEKDLVLGAPYKETYINYNGVSQTDIYVGNTFANTDDLETVVLPARLVEIAYEDFKYAGYYTTLSVTIEQSEEEPSRLATIGARAFASSKLASFVVPKSVRNLPPVLDPVSGEMKDRIGIGESAFDGCYSKFTSVTFEMGGTEPLTIGDRAFYNCDMLTEIILPARLAPYTSHTGDVIAPLATGAGVFEESAGVASISIEAADTAYYVSANGVLYTAGMKALVYYPASLEGALELPASVTSILDKAFLDATKLTALTFAEGSALTTIGASAFSGCNGLTTLVLPAGVTTLGEEVFYNCTSLESLTLSASLEGFDGDMITGCDALAAINVGADGKGTSYSSLDGVLYNSDATKLVFYPGAKEATEFTVPATVKYIAPRAFYDNAILVKVVLSEGLVEIGQQAFSYCTALEEINIPSTVNLIDRAAFANSRNLATLTFSTEGTEPLVIKYEAFYRTLGLTTVAFPARLAILDERSFYSSALTSVTFAENSALTDIGDYAFANNDFTSIDIPEGVVTIGDFLFYGCTSLESATFGEGLTTLGDSTFAEASAIKSVTFPASLKTLGVNTFYYYSYGAEVCANLETVIFPENSQLESIPGGTFAFTALKSFVVPASVKVIGDAGEDHEEDPGAFEGAAALELVTFADGSLCSSIGNNAFYECTALKFFTIPTSVSTLGVYAFYNCDSLTSVTVPETVTNLGYGLFQECDELSSVVLATKATKLSDYMFNGCDKLDSIAIPDTVTTIGSGCFGGTAFTKVTLPKSVTDISGYNIFARCESLEEVVILGDVTCLGREMFADCVNLTKVTLPSTVETIEENVFENCALIESFKIPRDLKNLAGAFSGTSLKEYSIEEGNTTFAVSEGVLFNADKTEIISYPVNKDSATFTVPKEIKFLGAGTFAGVTSLSTIIFEEGGTEPLEIGEEAFAEMTSLVKVVLPARLNKIGDYAFAYCSNLASINVPAGMDENDFGDYAFYNCVKLVEIKNESEIELAPGDTKCGYIAENAVRIYTEGESTVAVDAEGFITITESGEVYLLGYTGSLTELTFPAGITGIYQYAFYDSAITSVTIPEGVTTIQAAAFAEAGDLETVNLPTTLKTIGEEAFYYCSSLTSITLNEGLEVIEDGAFNYCSLASVTIPASVKSIGEYAFRYNDISGSILLGSALEVIGYRAFYGCGEITFLVPAAEKPEGWDDQWNRECSSDSYPVLWGYTGEDITYTFNSNGGSAVDSITSDAPIDLPAGPTLDGYVFMGWYDNEALEGDAISGQYYNGTKTTLYAKWFTEAEYEALFAGTSWENAIDLTVGETITRDMDDYQNVWYKYTATESGSYHINLGVGDTVVYYYGTDPTGYYEKYGYADYDSGSYTYANMDITLEAGNTYYIKVYSYEAGTYNMLLTKNA